MRFVRYVLPALIVLAGVVLALTVYGGTDTAVDALVALAGAGAATFMINMYLRFGFGDREQQERDEAAREFFEKYGQWPDEVPEDWQPPSVRQPTHVGR
ncbi:MAG: hypothetical protein HZB46_09810 [Solirubrobacterales bacterium]|nr:hypothetical protein [Solirubrobacterales bacterium]